MTDSAKHRECASQAALLKLSALDVQLALAGMDDRNVNAVLKAAGLRSSRRIIERGAHEILAARLRQLSPPEAHNVAALLMSHVSSRISELFEKESASIAEEFQNALPAIVASWPVSVVRLLIVLFWETGVINEDEQRAMSAALNRHSETGPPGTESPPSTGAGTERRDHATAELLSPLHRLVAAAVAGDPASRPPDEIVAAAVLFLHGLEPADAGTWFVLALSRQLAADGFDGTMSAAPPEEFRGAYDLGLLMAAAFRTSAPLPASAFRSRHAVLLLLTSLPQEWDTHRARLLSALIEADVAEALSAVAALDGPPRAWHGIANEIVGAALKAGPQAQKLLGVLEKTLAKWLEAPGAADPSELVAALSTVRLKRARLDRLRGDFASAIKVIERIPSRSLEPSDRIERERELALSELRLREQSDVVALMMTDGADPRRTIARALPAIKSILDWNPLDPFGRIVAGLHSFQLGENEDAWGQWQGLAEELVDEGERSTAAPLAFLRGVAALRTFEPALQIPGVENVILGLDLGYRPPPGLLAEVCELLDVHEATEALERVLRLVTDLQPGPAFTKLIGRRAATGHRASESTALELSEMPGLATADRYSLLRAAFDGAAARIDREAIETRLDLLEQFVGRAGDAALDHDWAEVLATNLLVRETLEPTRADLVRVGVLRRAGALDEAREICRALFFRAASGAVRDIDPHDLLELMVESGAPPEEVDDLRRVLKEPEVDIPQVQNLEPVRIVFVGGHEAQEKQARLIDRAVLEEFQGRVSIDWHIPRWTSNWAETADAVERSYERSDALVIMTFVRTMLGRRLRCSAGESGVPWVSCTGHGIGSIDRAIKRAVLVVAAQRTGRS